MTTVLYSAQRRASGARQYAQVGLESEVLSAGPEQLINLPSRGARTAAKKARLHSLHNETAARGARFSNAVTFVDNGPRAGGHQEAGGVVSEHLISSYELIIYHLLQANLQRDDTHLQTAETMLRNLHEAWNEAVDLARSESALS